MSRGGDYGKCRSMDYGRWGKLLKAVGFKQEVAEVGLSFFGTE